MREAFYMGAIAMSRMLMHLAQAPGFAFGGGFFCFIANAAPAAASRQAAPAAARIASTTTPAWRPPDWSPRNGHAQPVIIC